MRRRGKRIRISRSLQMSNIIYHYTSAEGFKGIIQSKALWCSDVRYLNDYQEVVFGQQWLGKIFPRMKRDNPELAKSIIIRRAVRKLTSDEITAFVCSFCSKGDLLSQWRGYAGISGLSLGFDTNKIRELVNIDIIPVVYKEDQLASNIVSAINKNYNLKNLEKNRSKLEFNLVKQILASKNSAFQEEDESRIVLTVDGINSHPRVRDNKVLYRSKGGLLVPYVELALDDALKDTLREVWIGPSPNAGLAWKSIKEFLAYNGLRGVEVRISSAPYRT